MPALNDVPFLLILVVIGVMLIGIIGVCTIFCMLSRPDLFTGLRFNTFLEVWEAKDCSLPAPPKGCLLY